MQRLAGGGGIQGQQPALCSLGHDILIGYRTPQIQATSPPETKPQEPEPEDAPNIVIEQDETEVPESPSFAANASRANPCMGHQVVHFSVGGERFH